MAWIKPTRDDLTATISAEEVGAFGQSADFTDAVDAILSRTVQLVRGHVRAGGRRLAADEATMPSMLLAPAMDYAAFDLLKRFNVPVGEDRRKARADAIALFEKVAERKIAVDPADEGEESATPAATPAAAPAAPPRLLD